MSKEWCEYEIDFLIKNYSINGVVYCSNKLNRSVNSIYLKSNKIGLVLEEKWCEEDDIFLIKNYSKLGIKKCSEILNRSIKSIKARTNKLKIKLINNEELINKFKIKHHDFYDYSLVNYIDSKTKIKIICPNHNKFEQLPYEHLRGKGCPICIESKGEKEIRNILLNKNIKFIPQYKFNDCKNINRLPFDFYLPDYNICIEYHGEQHYKPIKWFGGDKVFSELVKRDKIKLEYCKLNNIKLCTISYRKNIIKFINKIL
jgi:hypothetical protein